MKSEGQENTTGLKIENHTRIRSILYSTSNLKVPYVQVYMKDHSLKIINSERMSGSKNKKNH